MDALVSRLTAAEWDFDVSDSALRRASARIRGHLHQDITAGTSTIKARGPVFRLPQRPVVEVAAVVDGSGSPVGHTLTGSLLEVDTLAVVTVTYSHGYTDLPDELVELVCQVASRLGQTNPELAAGVQQQTAQGFSVGYGWDAWKAQAGLTSGEKETLSRYWPRLPSPVVAGPAA